MAEHMFLTTCSVYDRIVTRIVTRSLFIKENKFVLGNHGDYNNNR